MTGGHKHREIPIWPGSVLYPPLRWVLQRHLRETTNRNQAARSRWVWGRIDVDEPDYPVKYDRSPAPSPDVFVLTPLSILHTLFGAVLYTEPEPPRKMEP